MPNPASSHGGGGLPSNWTILPDGGLEIDVTPGVDDTIHGLVVKALAGGDNNLSLIRMVAPNGDAMYFMHDFDEGAEIATVANGVVAAQTLATGAVQLTGTSSFLGVSTALLKVTEGANARMGVATLGTGGTVTVATTAVTTSSRIFLTPQDASGAGIGAVRVSNFVAGTSFDIVSANTLDRSDVAWLIIEPA